MTHSMTHDEDSPTQSAGDERGVALLASPTESAGTDHSGSIEAALLSVDRPLSHARIAVALGLIESEDPEGDADTLPMPLAEEVAMESITQPAPLPAKKQRGRSAGVIKAHRDALNKATLIINASIAGLNESYAQSGRSFRIEQVAGGFRVMTLPAHAKVVASIHQARVWARLTRASIETLAIVAYKQPITRAQLDAIRGVACGEVLRTLMERRLVTIRGRAEELGRPILYGTTKQFLDHFGLSTLTDLPTLTELKPG